MKIPIKKYWWIALVILLMPIALNFILLTPSFTAIVGDEIAWLSFWGGYLGAIISTAAAFIILYIQRKDNESENEKNRADNKAQNELNRIENENFNRANRQLQLNIMKYHQQCHWLDNFRNASLEYVHAFNYNDVVMVSNCMWDTPVEAFNMIKNLFDRISVTNGKYAFARKQDERANHLTKYIDEQYNAYKQKLSDLQWVVLYFKMYTPPHRCKSHVIAFLQHQNIDECARLLQLITEHDVVHNDNRVYFNDIFLCIFRDVRNVEYTIREKVYSYIKEEQKVVDDLLSTNLN